MRKECSLVADMEEDLGVWIEDQRSHNIPESNPEQGPDSFQSPPERGEDAAEEKCQASKGRLRV